MLNYFEAAIWPIAVIIIAWLFRRPLVRFLDRVRNIKATGVEVAVGEQDTSQTQLGPSAADDFARTFDNQLLIEREDTIRTELARIVGKDETQKEKFLIRIIAAQAIRQQFEATYQSIWGSQLTALQIANTTLDGVQLRTFETLYNQAVSQYKELYVNYSFERWLGFMKSHLLCVSNDDKIHITLTGREFLKYIIHEGYTLYKHG